MTIDPYTQEQNAMNRPKKLRIGKKKRARIRQELQMKRCRYCKSTENLTIDHKVPLVHGGTNDLKNLQCLCKKCNGLKSGLSHNEVQRLFKWFLEIQESREKHGSLKYHIRHAEKSR